jgi:tetratricopeptide (TPR) repeat protein
MARAYLSLKKVDSALISEQLAYELVMQTGFKRYLGSVLLNMGRIYAAKGNIPLANEYYRKSLVASAENGYFRGVVASNILLADYYFQAGKKDSAFPHINDALTAAKIWMFLNYCYGLIKDLTIITNLKEIMTAP